MQAPNTDRVLEAKAPAKINLFLEVLGKHTDGYHEISSIAVPVSLYDELKFERAGNSIELACDNDDIPTGGDNLVVKAAEALRDACGVEAGARISLKKRIPSGAGLGGGSSDAAATLASLTQLWELSLGIEELVSLASRVGADVPFFLHGALAHIRGCGEKVTLIENHLGELSFLIAVPHFGVSTAAVYSQVRLPPAEQRRSASGMIEGFLTGDRELVERNVYNRLQEAAFAVEPRLEAFYRELTEAMDSAVTMTGSGSGFFVCCGSSQESEKVSQALREVGAPQVAQVQTVGGGNLLAAAREGN